LDHHLALIAGNWKSKDRLIETAFALLESLITAPGGH